MPGMPDEPIRKSVHHYCEPGHAHLLTFSCYQRMPLLTDNTRRRLLSQSINNAIAKQHYHLIAFVYMPEHVHLVVLALDEEYDVSRLLSAIKRPFSYRAKCLLTSASDPLLTRLTVRERPGKMAFRFWQEGSGHDRNVAHPGTLLAAAEYVHNNPVRRGLVESPGEWTWSSWKWYHEPEGYDLESLPRVHGVPV